MTATHRHCRGHSTMNPEPMHAFIDAFVIGEGEEVIHDIITILQAHPTRPERLLALARIPGVYVPAFYETSYMDDGTVSHIDPLVEGSPIPLSSASSPSFPRRRRSSSSRTSTSSTTVFRWRSCAAVRAVAAFAMPA